jgi:hypothetical protein
LVGGATARSLAPIPRPLHRSSALDGAAAIGSAPIVLAVAVRLTAQQAPWRVSNRQHALRHHA